MQIVLSGAWVRAAGIAHRLIGKEYRRVLGRGGLLLFAMSRCG
jgi:hypothetical protein